LLYGASAMSSNLNLGLRHMLPVYPFLFIAIGIAFARIMRFRDTAAMFVGAVLAAALAAESFAAFPNYIPFFNAGARAYRHELELLSDSNLDWGQDLKLLADWQQRPSNRHVRLYLVYFGTAYPEYYGIESTNLLYSMAPGPTAAAPLPPCVLAVSARHLQGIYVDSRLNPYVRLQQYAPLDVLGGSIYLYQLPLPPPSR
jgi:hypothetical protein